jgi:hypothetical protein
LPQAFEVLERHPSEVPFGEALERLPPYDLVERTVNRLRRRACVEDLSRLRDEIEVEVERRSRSSRIRIEMRHKHTNAGRNACKTP